MEETVLFFWGVVDGCRFKYGFSYWCWDTRQLLNLWTSDFTSAQWDHEAQIRDFVSWIKAKGSWECAWCLALGIGRWSADEASLLGSALRPGGPFCSAHWGPMAMLFLSSAQKAVWLMWSSRLVLVGRQRPCQVAWATWVPCDEGQLSLAPKSWVTSDLQASC